MTNEITDTFDLPRLLGEVLQECLQRGMDPPFIVCAISPNGSICSCRMTGEDEPEFFAEHYEGGGFRLPMTIVIVDQANDAAHVRVTVSGASWH